MHASIVPSTIWFLSLFLLFCDEAVHTEYLFGGDWKLLTCQLKHNERGQNSKESTVHVQH